ncbi:MAG: TetR family transcriptional regulator [Pseudomonadales bacterium]
MKRNTQKPRVDSLPRLTIKRVARRLIAERGVGNVTVRKIAQAAGQKNMGAVAYYFGTKDALISEILIDGASRIEKRRQKFLKKFEVSGGPHSVGEAVDAIVRPSAEFSDLDEEYGEYFNLFLLQLSLNNSELIDSTLEGHWNTAYQRCLAHLRRLTCNLSRAEQNRRFLFLAAYVSSLLATREQMFHDRSRDHPTWRSPKTLDDIVHTAAAIVLA